MPLQKHLDFKGDHSDIEILATKKICHSGIFGQKVGQRRSYLRQAVPSWPLLSSNIMERLCANPDLLSHCSGLVSALDCQPSLCLLDGVWNQNVPRDQLSLKASQNQDNG